MVISRTCSDWNKGQSLLYLNEFLKVYIFQSTMFIGSTNQPLPPHPPVQHQNSGVQPFKPTLILAIKNFLCPY